MRARSREQFCCKFSTCLDQEMMTWVRAGITVPESRVRVKRFITHDTLHVTQCNTHHCVYMCVGQHGRSLPVLAHVYMCVRDNTGGPSRSSSVYMCVRQHGQSLPVLVCVHVCETTGVVPPGPSLCTCLYMSVCYSRGCPSQSSPVYMCVRQHGRSLPVLACVRVCETTRVVPPSPCPCVHVCVTAEAVSPGPCLCTRVCVTAEAISPGPPGAAAPK